MTTNNGIPNAPRVTAADIENVDICARQLYRRARNSGADFADVAAIVRQLHTVLKHLKVEAEDPGSLLNSDQSPVYIRQLIPIVEDCEFHLKQLDTVLTKCSGHGSGSEGEGHGVSERQQLGSRELGMIAVIRSKLANLKANIDIFLDTVQLHNPSKSHKVVDTNNSNMDSIKDQVDTIAARIFQRRNSDNSDDNKLWLQFRDELEREGYARDVLRKNQDILRAYIRQLDEQSVSSGGLQGIRAMRDEPLQVAPYPTYSAPDEDFSPKEAFPSIENEKFFPSMKMERLQPEKYPPYPSSLPTQDTGSSYNHHSDVDDSEDASSENSMALVISTRELMNLDRHAFDKQESAVAHSMGDLQLQPPTRPYATSNYTHAHSSSSSPQTQFLPAGSNAGLLTSSPNLQPLDQYGQSPRYIPSLPPPPYGSSPPLTLHSNSISASAIPGGGSQSQVQRYARLAPDQLGRDIPLDAKWTRIRRALVSTQILSQAGVRFEARPDFVAVLGVFTRDEIAEFARRSAELRRRQVQQRKEQRDEKNRYYPDKYKNCYIESQRNLNGRGRAGSQFSSSSDLNDSSESGTDEDLPDYRARGHYHSQDERDEKHSETDKGTKVYPFIVPPPEKEKENRHSPSATVKPKPILKNKNDDPHVRFDPEPKVLDEDMSRSLPRRSERDRERESRDDLRRRERSDRDRHVPRSYDDRDRHHRNYYGGSTHTGSRRDKERDEYRRRRREDNDRDRYREREREEDRGEERLAKKKARGETLRAVGIGGAAASLLSVLTEAAAGL